MKQRLSLDCKKLFPTTFACIVFGVMVFVAGNIQVSAHEKWFHEARPFGLRWDLFFRPLPLVFTSGVLIVTFAAWLWWKRRGRSYVPGPETLGATDERRSFLYALIPLIVGVHVAVPLLVSGVQGELFTPNNQIAPGFWRYALGLAQTGIALALFYGGLTRLAALALGVLWFAGIPLVGLEQMLDSIMYLGFAAFFFLAGRGPVSIDRLALPLFAPSPRMMSFAVTALRAGLGLSLIFVAFTEKLANLPLAQSFLEQYPLNFTPWFGIPLSNEVFILCAGSIELLVGLWILFDIFTREIILIAWIPINLTLTVFNWTELIGHLPIYGTLAILLVWSPGEANRALWMHGLRDVFLPEPRRTQDNDAKM